MTEHVKWFGNNTYHWVIARSTSMDFDTFHRDNPEVYATLLAVLDEYMSKTMKKYCGFDLLWNRMRWELETNPVDGKDPEGYKFNDKYKGGYSRLIMANNSRFADVFEIRCRDYCTICTSSKKHSDNRFKRGDG